MKKGPPCSRASSHLTPSAPLVFAHPFPMIPISPKLAAEARKNKQPRPSLGFCELIRYHWVVGVFLMRANGHQIIFRLQNPTPMHGFGKDTANLTDNVLVENKMQRRHYINFETNIVFPIFSAPLIRVQGHPHMEHVTTSLSPPIVTKDTNRRQAETCRCI